MKQDEDTPFVAGTNDETLLAGGTAVAAVAAGIGAAMVKAKLDGAAERGNARLPRRRQRAEGGRTEPALAPFEPSPCLAVLPNHSVSNEPQAGAAQTKRRWLSKALTAAMLLCFAIGGWCGSQLVTKPSRFVASAGTESRTRNVTENIEDVRLGRRLVGRNPLREQTQSPTDINPVTHRAVRLEMEQHGTLYELAFVRSLKWLDQQQATVGGTIHLVMSEMGLDGEARVLAIDPCPEIEPDDGTGRMIVTGTMKHLAANVLEVEIAGELQPLGVTDTHPIWSEDRQDFVVAGQLRTGERLKQSNGTLTQVTRITPMRGPPVMVYNLEIDGEHVYHVGENGLLVHNACPLQQAAEAERDRIISLMKDKYSGNKLRDFSTVVAGVDPATGKVIVKAKSTSRYGDKLCAENLVSNAFGNNPNIIMSQTIRPRNGAIIPVCPRCQESFPPAQFFPNVTFTPSP